MFQTKKNSPTKKFHQKLNKKLVSQFVFQQICFSSQRRKFPTKKTHLTVVTVMTKRYFSPNFFSLTNKTYFSKKKNYKTKNHNKIFPKKLFSPKKILNRKKNCDNHKKIKL